MGKDSTDRAVERRVVASVVTHNSESTVTRCIDSLAASDVALEIAVVDNASTDSTCERLARSHPDVRVIRSKRNLGFGAAHNLVLREATAPFVILLNPDAWLEPTALPRLLDAMDTDPASAIVAPRVEYPDGCPQVSFGPFPGWWADWRQGRRVSAVRARRPAALRRLESRLRRPFHPDWVSGSCFLARSEPLREIGFFDERFFLYLEDADLCRRLRSRGFGVRVQPDARCRHVEGASHVATKTMRAHFRRSRLLYETLHGSRFGALLYGRLRGAARPLPPHPPDR